MDAFEIGIFGLIAGFHQDFETAAHQVNDAAAQNGLFTEQVGLGLLIHRGLQDPRTGSADPGDVSQGDIIGLAGGILFDSDQAGNALSGNIGAADGVARTLRRGHENVHIRRRDDPLVADVEAVREGDGFAFGHIRCDLAVVNIGLDFIIDEHHDDVGFFRGF